MPPPPSLQLLLRTHRPLLSKLTRPHPQPRHLPLHNSTRHKASLFPSQLRTLYNQHEPRLLALTTLACALFVAWHVLPMQLTSGPSMLPTLLVNDGVLWSPLHRRGRGIAVGDIVAARSPYEPGGAVVKRVLGMPGDVVCVTRNTGAGDDEQLQLEDDDEVKIASEGGSKVAKVAASQEARYIVVPRGHCWIEGDNLPWSVDSRHYGPVPLGLIVGKVVVVQGSAAPWSWRWIGNDRLADADVQDDVSHSMDG